MLPTWEIAVRLLLAALLGGIIGVNRGRLEWAAGLRTHMLVCVGSALAIIVSAFGFNDVLGQQHVILDPSRIAAQVVSGVGFLGAGTILFLEREQVIRGLTTAAGLWAVASIGLAAGSGLYAAASIATAMLWIILALLKPLERRYLQRRRLRNGGLRIAFTNNAALAPIEQALAAAQLPFKRLLLKHDGAGSVLDVRCATEVERERLQAAAARVLAVEGVSSVEPTGAAAITD